MNWKGCQFESVNWEEDEKAVSALLEGTLTTASKPVEMEKYYR